jgi:hypothetical protein
METKAMRGLRPIELLLTTLLLALCVVGVSPRAQAQDEAEAGAAPAAGGARQPPSARARAAFDVTGYWVSLVTQNWRYRMIVPGHGDYAGIPITLKAKQFADAWRATADIAAGKQCEAYGAPALMQDPERLHIVWQDDETLRVDTDEGMQTRLLHFRRAASDAQSAPSLQGDSHARWALAAVANSLNRAPAADAPRFGSLVVTTEHLAPGLLRKNGIPYGANAKLSEFWKLHRLGPAEWLLISTKMTDPEYLASPYVYDSIFQQETDGSKWAPSPCSLTS